MRSAGTYAQLLEKDEAKGLALLRMQSKEQRYVQISCLATVGEVSNPEHKNQTLGKAGRSRWMGRRYVCINRMYVCMCIRYVCV